MTLMIFKNRFLISLVVVGLFLSLSNQANAKTSKDFLEISYEQNNLNIVSNAFEISFLPSNFLEEYKSLNLEIQKLKRKPLNKKLYRKIKKFLNKKRIRRKRRIIAEDSTPNRFLNQIG